MVRPLALKVAPKPWRGDPFCACCRSLPSPLEAGNRMGVARDQMFWFFSRSLTLWRSDFVAFLKIKSTPVYCNRKLHFISCFVSDRPHRRNITWRFQFEYLNSVFRYLFRASSINETHIIIKFVIFSQSLCCIWWTVQEPTAPLKTYSNKSK